MTSNRMKKLSDDILDRRDVSCNLAGLHRRAGEGAAGSELQRPLASELSANSDLSNKVATSR